MDIVKRLSLNKTPKSVENNSIVAAKNIMIDNTGSYITNEPGFSVAFECPNNKEFIVGCIPCTEEIVIFTYCLEDKVSRIYRYFDEGYYIPCTTGWKYNGGKIIGTYTYNYKKELIIAVAEYDAYDEYGHKLLVPLKSWNLNTSDIIHSNNTEELIPKFTSQYIINNGGSLLCGVYTLFIRFKIDDNSYTKWFQISDDIVIVNIVDKEGTHHNFLNANNTTVVSVVMRDENNNVANLKINDDLMSSNSIVLTFKFDDDCNYNEYQLGYIYKRKSDLVARIKNTYSIATTTVSIDSNEYTEETTIDQLLENPHQFYNVKSLINYNNRLYIANYDEYRNENLQNYADKIDVNIINKSAENSGIDTKTIEHYSMNLSTGDGSSFGTCSTFVKDVDVYTEGGNKYIKNPVDFIKRYIAAKTFLKVEAQKTKPVINLEKSYSFRQVDNDRKNVIFATYDFGLYVMLKNNPSSNTCIYDTTDANLTYKLKIEEHVNDNVTTYSVVLITSTNQQYDLTYESGNVGFNIKIHSIVKVTGTDSYTIDSYYWYFNDGEHDPRELRGGVNISFAPNKYTTQIITTKDNVYNNNRTLVPNQIYSFYVHFIRPDYSVTDGFKLTPKPSADYNIVTNNNGDALYKIKIPNISTPLCFPIFSNIEYPKSYIGCFISYEELEQSVIPVIAVKTEDNGNKAQITNTNYIFNDDQLYGSSIIDIISDEEKTIVNKVVSRGQLIHPNIEIRLDTGETINKDHLLELETNSQNIYSRANKKLFRLTNNIFGDSSIDTSGEAISKEAFMYLPGFYNEEKIIYYNDKLILSPASSNVINDSGTAIDTYSIKIRTTKNYSNKPLDAYTTFEDYSQGAVSLVDNEGQAKGVYYNKTLGPDKLKTFLKLEQCYEAAPDKIYTNYSKFHSDIFTKTLYRSNVISDESLVNGFREFVASNYKNIFENKGDIINIVGIGLYLIVHMQYSMFVFDRTPKLTQRSQLDIPDVFDISYQEVMPSNEGFGGLADRNEAILTKQGYYWFDKINKYIFTYENGGAKIVSNDINNFIKNLDIDTVRFAEDLINNRLLICIYLNSYNENNKQDTITISYSFVTNTFISLHDYSFSHNFRTYNQSYLFNENTDKNRLYIFDKNANTYLNLANENSVYYPTYIHEYNPDDYNMRPWIPDYEEW